MLSQEAIQAALGITEKVHLTASEMADRLNVTFYPSVGQVSSDVSVFVDELRDALTELKVNVVPFDDALEPISFFSNSKRFVKATANNFFFLVEKATFRNRRRFFIPPAALRNIFRTRRVRKGISIIASGSFPTWNLPMDYSSSFRHGSVITVMDWPKNISEKSDFLSHFDTAMALFAYNMSNIVIAVNKDQWLLYNFNASHPIFPRGREFKENVLHALVPKIFAPISPHRFSDFEIIENGFDIKSDSIRPIVDDMVKGAKLFDKTKLYPPGKKVADLPFRNSFYRWIGHLHLDERSGMSFGFMSRQLPTEPSILVPVTKWQNDNNFEVPKDIDYFTFGAELYFILQINSERYVAKCPEVAVLSQRSGCDKTNFIPEKDLIILGLKNGRMYMKTPNGLKLTSDYKPSFDTKVILSHALGNAIVASVAFHLDSSDRFAKQLKSHGAAIAHWHGYIDPELLPSGFPTYGARNPHVACSSPQSAIYAIQGKLAAYKSLIGNKAHVFLGDVHVEPHHGTNVTFSTIEELATFLIDNPGASVLGNKYLVKYQS
jgi:hypothetical protein